jgi:hypothetical protein
MVWVRPFADGLMSVEQLAAWYRRFGFTEIQVDPPLMVRQARVPARLYSPVRDAVHAAVRALH